MIDTTTVVDRYIAAWNERDPEVRRDLVARTFTDDASYVDPLVSGDGPEGIDAMIAGAQELYPGHGITLVDGPDSHHDRMLFAWTLAPAGAAPVARGVDFAVLAEDGRISSVTGFLEAL